MATLVHGNKQKHKGNTQNKMEMKTVNNSMMTSGIMNYEML